MTQILLNFLNAALVVFLFADVWLKSPHLAITCVIVSLCMAMGTYVLNRLSGTSEEDPEIEYEYEIDEEDGEDQ